VTKKKPSGELVDGCPIVFDDDITDRFAKVGLGAFEADLKTRAREFVRADSLVFGDPDAKAVKRKKAKAEEVSLARLESAAFDYAMAKLVHDAIEKVKKNPLIVAVP